MKNIIELSYNIGDEIYVVEDYNSFYDNCKYYETIYDSQIKIKKYIIEGFIINEDGVFIAEEGHDGYNKFDTYHKLTLDKYQNCKIFNNKNDAIKFVKSIIK